MKNALFISLLTLMVIVSSCKEKVSEPDKPATVYYTGTQFWFLQGDGEFSDVQVNRFVDDNPFFYGHLKIKKGNPLVLDILQNERIQFILSELGDTIKVQIHDAPTEVMAAIYGNDMQTLHIETCQEGDTAMFSGRLVDASRNPLAGRTVFDMRRTTVRTETNSNGAFQISLLLDPTQDCTGYLGIQALKSEDPVLTTTINPGRTIDVVMDGTHHEFRERLRDSILSTGNTQ